MNIIKMLDDRAELWGFKGLPDRSGFITVRLYGSKIVITPGKERTQLNNSYYELTSKTITDKNLVSVLKAFIHNEACAFIPLEGSFYQDSVPVAKDWQERYFSHSKNVH